MAIAAPSKMKQQERQQFEHSVDAALGWVARLRSDSVSEADRQEFALWLGQHPSHTSAMDEALALWDDLAVVRHTSVAAPQQAAANNSRWLSAGTAAVACLVMALLLWPGTGTEPVRNEYKTALGERRDITLPDGSRALLNTSSYLTVSYTEEQRHITLQRGEAWFQVEPDQNRPFHVDAGSARVTALGTAFNIYIHDESADITVTEGVVKVTERGETGARAAAVEVLRENQRLLTSSAMGWEVKTPDLEQQLAWQQGQLLAREMPLPSLLQQLQRYYDMDILVTDPDIAALTVSGLFNLDQPEATLAALALSLNLQTRSIDANTLQLLKADH